MEQVPIFVELGGKQFRRVEFLDADRRLLGGSYSPSTSCMMLAATSFLTLKISVTKVCKFLRYK